MPKLEEELKHFPYGWSFHDYESDSLGLIKDKAINYINDTYTKLSMSKDSIKTEEGYNVRCSLGDICELEWRINNDNGKDTAYLYLKDNGYVVESKDRLREILVKMKERFIQLNVKRNNYLAEVEKCTDKRLLLDMDIDWS